MSGTDASRRAFLGAFLATTGAALSVAHGSVTPRRGGTLIIGTPTEPPTLTSALNSQTDGGVSGKVFSGLLTADALANPAPDLATSWSVAADNLSLTFKLRPGVTWHDGKPFTSTDVAFSILEIWRVYPSRGRATYANVTAVDTPDALTAIVRLSKPAPYLLSALMSTDARLLPKHLYEKGGVLTNPRNNSPIGTGPFRFVKWERGSHVLLERNPRYWDQPKPFVDQIVIRFLRDSGSAAAALETGQVHISDGIAPADIARLVARKDLVLVLRLSGLQAGIISLEFNLDRPVFRDVRVRRAFAHAIDQRFIVENIWRGNASIATGPVPPDMKAFYTDAVPRYPFDLKKAEALLEAAGLKRNARGDRLSIFIDPLQIGATPTVQTAQYLRGIFNKIGVRLQVRTQDFGEYVSRVFKRRDFDTTISSNVSSPDPAIAIQRLYWSKAFQPGVSFSNAMHYSSPEVDRLLEQGQIETDVVRRRELYEQFQRLAQSDLPRIPIVATRPVFLSTRKVLGVANTVNGITGSFAELSL